MSYQPISGSSASAIHIRAGARTLLAWAVRGRRHHGSPWGEAVLAEFDETVGAWASIRWAAGGLKVALRERWHHRRERARTAWRAAPPWARVTALFLTCAVVPSLAVGLVNQLALSVVYVPSAAMDPGIHISDRILIDKLGFRLSGLDRGDTVVVRLHGTHAWLSDQVIRRIVALPGDRVDCAGGEIRVNGLTVRQPHRGTVPVECPAVTVGEGKLYLLGDNLDTARDSRQFGTVETKDVVGRAVVRVWPPIRSS